MAEGTEHEVDKEVLLAEYNACLERIALYDERIWQSVFTFLVASVAGIPFLLSQTGGSEIDEWMNSGLAVAAIFFLINWRHMLHRWSTLLNGESIRAQEIEKTLGMLRETYMFGPADNKTAAEFRRNLEKRGWKPVVRGALDKVIRALMVLWFTFGVIQVLLALSIL
jgi:hypothetical protein